MGRGDDELEVSSELHSLWGGGDLRVKEEMNRHGMGKLFINSPSQLKPSKSTSSGDEGELDRSDISVFEGLNVTLAQVISVRRDRHVNRNRKFETSPSL